MSEWISVEDGLPEEWDRVLICDVNDDIDEYKIGVTEATFAPCGKGCCEPRFESEGLEYIDHTNVTHWMYMPKPPKDLF